MMPKRLRPLLFVLACLWAAAAQAAGPRLLSWADLQPPGEAEHNARIAGQMQQMLYESIRNRRANHYAQDVAGLRQQLRADVVPALDRQRVRLAGYMVPLDFDADQRTTEFLLVPFYGACLHVPAPPRNQVVHVVAQTPQPVGDLSVPIEVEGVLTLEREDGAMASYRVDLARARPWDGGEIRYDGPRPHPDGN